MKYPSESYQATKDRRLRRSERSATPELMDSFAIGKLSLRQFDQLSRLPVRQQRATLARQQQESEHARLAAKVISDLLDQAPPGLEIRLSAIANAIHQAVTECPVPGHKCP